MVRSPLAIVGTGGSGTRAFARLAEAAGRAMGAHQSEANDAIALFDLANKWCRRIYPAWQAGGWKQPRSLYMLPALASACPGLLVLHVLRDGRDLAFGKRFRLAVASDYAVPIAADDEPPEVRLALLWAGPIVKPPPTLGRWRDADPSLLERVTDAASDALRRFGYR